MKRWPVSRRQVLVGAAAGGGLLVAWGLYPREYDAPLVPADDEAAFGGWLTIGSDGVVTVAVPQLEMGQGVTTLLPQIAATELGADWRQIAVAPVPPSGAHANLPLAEKWAPLWAAFPAFVRAADDVLVERFARGNAFCATAEGTTLAAYEMPCREAAAAARAMLAMAAAKRWGVAWEECAVEDGFVSHGDRRIGFGPLALDAARFAPPDPPPLRPEPLRVQPEIGEIDESFVRLDLPAKVDGSYPFAGDIRLPGMVHAAIRHGPWGQTELVGFDEAGAADMPGLVGVVRHRRWLAAAAASWWTAERALTAMRPRFDGPGAVDSAAIEQQLQQAVESGEAERIAAFGEPVFGEGGDTISRAYAVSPAVHAAVETATATARLSEGRLELWIVSQAPEAAREAAARAVGVSLRDTVIYPMGAGGSFDARLEKQHAIEAAQIARALGRPVQLTWSRAEEMQALPPRTPVAAILSARLSPGEDRLPQHWRTRIAVPATVREFGRRLFANDTPEAALEAVAGQTDPLACDGAVPPYALANLAVDHAPVALDLPTGRLRGNAAAYTAFFTESFVDELATKAGRDPFLYRMAMLGQAPRMADCLRRATRLGQWDGGRQGSGQGLAMVRMGAPATGGRIACVAQASLAQGGVRVTRLSAAVDIGRIVNADIARQQIEGGLLFGLSLALGSAVRYEAGRPVPARLAGLDLPLLADAPDVAIEFVTADGPPFDPGELGVAVAPPAIANALHAATGVRFRRLPLLSEGI